MVKHLDRIIFIAIACALSSIASAQDWSKNASVPSGGRQNTYGMTTEELARAVRNGRLHALNYPVAATELVLPYAPIANFLAANSSNPLRYILEKFISSLSSYKSIDDVEKWVGLHLYPNQEGSGPYFIPFRNGARPEERMGFTILETKYGKGFTVSCAECHSANLFGVRVLGMTNRFPRANAVFDTSLKLVPHISPTLFQFATGASDGEIELYKRTVHAAKFVAAKTPIQLGLDTSLAQVALSLAKRERDPWASRVEILKRFEPLENHVADSKPAVWWNVKYKNRWLSDGSVVSGNPIFTNFIWNEIGRGTDLHRLDEWLVKNEPVVRDLTSAVFASEPPLWTDFFPAELIDEGRARNGEKIFNQRCAKCHGVYSKAWSQPGAGLLSAADRLKTTNVEYRNLVVDVGTDPGRHQGMKSLEQLNGLEISKRNGIVIEAQKGYMPPPLVGIWARWPYFHNNSAPSLCAVLTRASERPKGYWASEALDRNKDFDQECNGYPVKPRVYKDEYFYDTSRTGMHATGHDEGIFLENGKELLQNGEKTDLIIYLQTL